MKESYREGLASHPGPESCGEVVRPNPKRGQGYRQAGLSSSENVLSSADAVKGCGRLRGRDRDRKSASGSAAPAA